MALERTISELNALVGSLNATGSMEGAIIGAKGDKGDKGDTGDTGNGIQSVTKTSTSGLVDTYTILYTNGTTSTFAVTNGEDGTTYYTWIKYADTPTSGMSDNPTGKTYIGVAYNKSTPVESTN